MTLIKHCKDSSILFNDYWYLCFVVYFDYKRASSHQVFVRGNAVKEYIIYYTYWFSIMRQSCIMMLHLFISEFLYNLLKCNTITLIRLQTGRVYYSFEEASFFSTFLHMIYVSRQMQSLQGYGGNGGRLTCKSCVYLSGSFAIRALIWLL